MSLNICLHNLLINSKKLLTYGNCFTTKFTVCGSLIKNIASFSFNVGEDWNAQLTKTTDPLTDDF